MDITHEELKEAAKPLIELLNEKGALGQTTKYVQEWENIVSLDGGVKVSKYAEKEAEENSLPFFCAVLD